MNKKLKHSLIQSFKDSFEPIYTGSVYQWANSYVDLPPNYAVTGKFNVDISKYLIQPFEDLKDPSVTQINTIAATQTGKSLISEIFIPYLIVNDPGPVMRLHQTDEMAALFTETRLIPLLKRCDPVKNLLEVDRFAARKTGLNLPHMMVKIAGQKENVLHGSTIRYLICDEAWLYNKDAIQKAKARTTAYGNNKKILIASQPGFEQDQLDDENRGLIYEWAWKCPHCNEYQPYYWSKEKPDGTWAGMVWDKIYKNTDSSSYDYEKTGETARLQCFYCTGSVNDTETNRRYLNDTGKYIQVADNGDHKVHTYTWCAFVNQKITFKEKVIQYLQATIQHKRFGLTDGLRVFQQQVLGKPWRQAQVIDQSAVLTQTFNPMSEWPDQIFRCLTVDYQKRFGAKVYSVVAFSRNEIRVLEHGVVTQWDDIQRISDKFRISPPAVAVDSGYDASTVYLESYNRGKVVAVGKRAERVGWTCLKGEDQDDGYKHKLLDGKQIVKYYSPLTRAAITNTAFARLFRWANFPIKNILWHIKEGKADMKLILPTPDPEFTEQLNAETLQEVIDAKTGLKKLRWVKVSDANHYFDCIAMAIVMAMMADRFGPEPEKLSVAPKMEDIQKKPVIIQ